MTFARPATEYWSASWTTGTTSPCDAATATPMFTRRSSRTWSPPQRELTSGFSLIACATACRTKGR